VQGDVGFVPACAATGSGFDHLQTRFSFGAALRAFELDLLQPFSVCAQFFL
jgi:hypothetical protein